MKMHLLVVLCLRRHLFQLAIGSAVFAVFAGSSLQAFAAPPELNYFYPAGAVRGSTSQLTGTGDFPRWPVQVWTSHPGVKLTPEADKGKFKLEVAGDTPAGIHWIRCYDDEGATVPRPLCIGALPEVQESETNDVPEKWQQIACPATVNGRLRKNGDIDCFVVQLSAGQTLIASLLANNELGSPMDGVLQIAWITNPTPMPGGVARPEAFVLEQIDDSVGLDPRIAFKVPRDGSYLIRVFAFPQEPNSTIGFAGNENYVYRLTLTTGGFIDHARPLAVQRDAMGPVELVGWNLSDTQKQSVPALLPELDAASAQHPELASHAILGLSEYVVTCRNNSVQGPTTLAIPSSTTACLERPGERHEYMITASKDDKLNMRVDSRSLNFAADAQIAVYDAAGKLVAEKDDGGSRRNRNLDPSTTVTVPADGNYRIVVDDAYGHGSDRHVYQLTVEKVAPRVAISVAAHGYVIAAGKTVEVPINIDRQDGFADPLRVVIEGLPPGVTAAETTSAKDGATAKEVKVTLTAEGTAAKWSGAIAVYGVSESGTKYRARYRLAEYDVDRNDVWLTVMPAAQPVTAATQ